MFRDSRSLSIPKEEKAISIYSKTSVSRTRRDCQNVFELLVVQATEVAYFQREQNKFGSDLGQFRCVMINCCPRQWSLEVIKQIKFFRKFSKAMASE